MVTHVSLGDLGSLIQIGRGGEGIVYRVPEVRFGDGTQAYVYKEYKNRYINPSALDRIIDAPKYMAPRRRAALKMRSVWPVAVVMRDDDHLAGVLMPLISDRFFQQATFPRAGPKLIEREIQHLIASADKNRRIGLPHADRRQRLDICRDLAYVFGLLHGERIVYGDVNARNILYSFEPTPQVCLLDCDGLRVQGQAAVTQQLHAPDWASPEDRNSQNISTDLYKLGLLFLRILAPGDGSSVNRDPDRAADTLDHEGRRLLQQALGTKRCRPTARQWFEYFDTTITGGKTTRTQTRGWVRDEHGDWVKVH